MLDTTLQVSTSTCQKQYSTQGEYSMLSSLSKMHHLLVPWLVLCLPFARSHASGVVQTNEIRSLSPREHTPNRASARKSAPGSSQRRTPSKSSSRSARKISDISSSTDNLPIRSGRIVKVSPPSHALSGVAPSRRAAITRTFSTRRQSIAQAFQSQRVKLDRDGKPITLRADTKSRPRRNPSRYTVSASYHVHGPAEARVAAGQQIDNNGWDNVDNVMFAPGASGSDSVTSLRIARAHVLSPRPGIAKATGPRVEVSAFPDPGGTVTITADSEGYRQFRHTYQHSGNLAPVYARQFRSSTPGLPITVKAHIQGDGVATVQGLTPIDPNYNQALLSIINMERG